VIEKDDDMMRNSSDPDEAPEWDEDAFGKAELAVGGKVVREATGTLTRRGRPPLGDTAKQQVTLRLPRAVIEHFKGGRRRLADTYR
jgi:uncharacterized protein (DUF4415 family)